MPAAPGVEAVFTATLNVDAVPSPQLFLPITVMVRVPALLKVIVHEAPLPEIAAPLLAVQIYEVASAMAGTVNVWPEFRHTEGGPLMAPAAAGLELMVKVTALLVTKQPAVLVAVTSTDTAPTGKVAVVKTLLVPLCLITPFTLNT